MLYRQGKIEDNEQVSLVNAKVAPFIDYPKNEEFKLNRKNQENMQVYVGFKNLVFCGFVSGFRT